MGRCYRVLGRTNHRAEEIAGFGDDEKVEYRSDVLDGGGMVT